MFDKSPQNGAAAPTRSPASDLAQIEGGGLVQVIVTNLHPLTYFVFLNDREVPQIEIESLSLSVEAPTDSVAPTVVRATLNRYQTNITGERSPQRTELFPCTIEVVALGRRLSVTCMNPNSLEGLWVSLGLKADGTGSDLSDLQSVRFLLTEGILDAKLTWMDGTSENLLPQ